MSTNNVIPFELPSFQIDTVDEHQDNLTITAHVTANSAICPSCGVASSNVHSYYMRCPRDLPVSDQIVQLRLYVRRFRCWNEQCPKKTFAERLPELVLPHAQRTVRLTTLLRQLGFALGGEAGARIVPYLRIAISADTLLRIMRQTGLSPPPAPRVLGIDDWAFRKGHTYGTILVDLERHNPIDMLPDREANTLAAWLQNHPGVEIITRDRSGDYAAGATQGAPNAVQVADRWHLLKNLGEALQKLLESRAADLRSTARYLHELSMSTEVEPEPNIDNTPSSTNEPKMPLGYRELLFQEVQELAAQGHAQRDIARQLNLHRNTVARYLRLDGYTQRCPPQSISTVTPYWDYLQRRWHEGYRCVKELWQEIQDQGYTGSYQSVWRALCPLRSAQRPQRKATPPSIPTLSARKAMWLLVKVPERLDEEEQRQLAALCQCCSVAAQAYPLAQRFVQMIRALQADKLDIWIQDAKASSLKYLCTFAIGLMRDYQAVKAALTFVWSNGQTEGQVNRLKCIKRQMYGRAKFDLLRLRVLYPT